MATDTATTQAQGIVNFASGDSTGAGAAIDVTLGFKPRYVKVFNETDAIMWEKFEAEADADSAKTDTAVAKDTGSAIVIKGSGATDTYKGFQMSATLAASGKALFWVAWG